MQNGGQPTTSPRWAAAKQRTLYGINHMARRSVRDVVREFRSAQREAKKPCDPWIDAIMAGRSGNACADFLTRFALLMQAAGECPKKIRARLVDIAHRVADATHLAHHRA